MMDVSSDISALITKKLDKIVDKLFDDVIEVRVVLQVQKYRNLCEILITGKEHDVKAAQESGESMQDAINLALDIVRMGGLLSLLGLPAGHSVTINDYTRNVIFKGVTLQGIIGRRMYGTWQRMLALLKSGLDVEWIVQAAFDSLNDFHEGVARFDRHEALKVVFFPEGEVASNARMKR